MTPDATVSCFQLIQPFFKMNHDEQDEQDAAAGLQRQLDELKRIIQQQPDGSSGSQREEVSKLKIRVAHLLRALDAKDRVIKELLQHEALK